MEKEKLLLVYSEVGNHGIPVRGLKLKHVGQTVKYTTSSWETTESPSGD